MSALALPTPCPLPERKGNASPAFPQLTNVRQRPGRPDLNPLPFREGGRGIGQLLLRHPGVMQHVAALRMHLEAAYLLADAREGVRIEEHDPRRGLHDHRLYLLVNV